MSGTVRGEIWLLGGSVCTGIALMMMYDGLRIFRWLVRHGSFWTGMEDAAYWLFASFATFRLLFGQNDGVLRGYAVAGVLGGMVFYDRTGSRLLFAVLKKCSGWIKMKRRGKKSQKTGKKQGDRQKTWKGSEMRMRRQMSEGRPGGNMRKKKKDNLNNRMALVGVTMVVLSLAVAVHIKGIDLKEKDRSYSIREENLEAQVAKEEERAKQLEEYRVYVQTKQYIEKVAKEKLGLVNRNEILLKPSNPN